MFSQFRQAVEGFAPPPPRRSGSQDQTRSGSPGPGSLPKSNSMPEARPKSKLEDRLRAKLAAAERKSSIPPPVPVIEHPLSPKSIPLPNSPALSAALVSTFEIDAPLSLASIGPPENQSPKVDVTPEPDTDASTVAPPTVAVPLELEKETTDVVVDSELPVSEFQAAESAPPEADTSESVAVEPISTPAEPSVVEVVHSPPVPESAVVEQDKPPKALSTEDSKSSDSDVEVLQNRLKLVEQRFTDVSTSFKRLQAEKLAADAVFRELSPLETMWDVEGLRNYLENLNLKTEISQDEIKRLTGKLQRQDARMEELHDTHHLESASQSDQIDKLRRQAEESEALLKAAHGSSAQDEAEISKRNAEIEQLQAEVVKATALAKEEEEKRVKAISLLKTLRQKLVKADKDKEDIAKELNTMKERGDSEREKERTERTRLQREVEAVEAEREKAVAGLKARFDKEVGGMKDRHEKELSALRGQLELEAVTTKSTHVKEITAKNSQISALENSVNSLSKEKNAFFEELQLRQAELESSQSHLDSLQGQNTELHYQLRECQDRVAALTEEVIDARRQPTHSPRVSTTSAEDIARLLSSAEAKYEAKLAELRKNLAAVEKERNEGEAGWSRKLREKTRETDELKRVLQASAKTRDEKEEVADGLKGEIERLRAEITIYQRQMSALHLQADKFKETETSSNNRLLESKARLTALEQQVEESKAHEAQLRAHNKTLRDEMRKVQSSAALLERQRNPGVGYWTSRPDNSSADVRTSISSNSSELPSRTASPKPAATKNEEEVNLEYLRNVILQFLEHKEMRPNLVKVLSIILHFTPQETRRIIAKV